MRLGSLRDDPILVVVEIPESYYFRRVSLHYFRRVRFLKELRG